MKKLFSISYGPTAFSFAMLFLRVVGGGLMIPHGFDKIKKFDEYKAGFMNFMHIGQGPSLAIDIFAEFFCAMLIILGLFTRLATIPLIVAMFVAFFLGEHGDLFGAGEHAAMYIGIYTTLLLVGPGRASVDAMIK